MKTLLILSSAFLISLNVFSQEKDSYNLLLFSEIKKIPLEMEDQKHIIIDNFDKIYNETKDETLKELILKEKEIVLKKQFNNSVKYNSTDDLSKEDLKGIRIITDKFNKTSNIYAKSNVGTLRFSILLTDKNNMYLRFTPYYSGKNWVFFKYVTILADDNSYMFVINDTRREVRSGFVEEYGSILLDIDKIEDFKKILNTNGEISVRFSGDKISDKTLNKPEIQRLKKILDVYEKLKNE